MTPCDFSSNGDNFNFSQLNIMLNQSARKLSFGTCLENCVREGALPRESKSKFASKCARKKVIQNDIFTMIRFSLLFTNYNSV